MTLVLIAALATHHACIGADASLDDDLPVAVDLPSISAEHAAPAQAAAPTVEALGATLAEVTRRVWSGGRAAAPHEAAHLERVVRELASRRVAHLPMASREAAEDAADDECDDAVAKLPAAGAPACLLAGDLRLVRPQDDVDQEAGARYVEACAAGHLTACGMIAGLIATLVAQGRAAGGKLLALACANGDDPACKAINDTKPAGWAEGLLDACGSGTPAAPKACALLVEHGAHQRVAASSERWRDLMLLPFAPLFAAGGALVGALVGLFGTGLAFLADNFPFGGRPFGDYPLGLTMGVGAAIGAGIGVAAGAIAAAALDAQADARLTAAEALALEYLQPPAPSRPPQRDTPSATIPSL